MRDTDGLQTIGAFPVESPQHHQVGGVRHGAFVQIVLLHLQPVALAGLVGALEQTDGRTAPC